MNFKQKVIFNNYIRVVFNVIFKQAKTFFQN